MLKTNLDELKKIPVIDVGQLSGRVIPPLSFFYDGEWHFWYPLPNGSLVDLKAQPSESDYFAREREKSTDMYFGFLNFMYQRAFWSNVAHPINSIRKDIHNLGASLAKLDLFYKQSKESELGVTRFVSTELQYIFVVCRSIFDMLQKIIKNLWDKIELVDKTKGKKHLPDSFRAMIIRNDSLMKAHEIEAKHKIPGALAEFYFRQAHFFQILRKYRDNITHSGHEFSFIYSTEKGFAVDNDQKPFSIFNVWNEEHMLPNGLSSLRPAIAYVITQTLDACEDFAHTIQQIIQFPPDIAPGFKLLVRGYHNKELLKLEEILTNCMWWDS